jgi:hypothetical protein
MPQQCPALTLIQQETNVFYFLLWFSVLGLLALWSVAAWAFHAAAGWTASKVGALADGSQQVGGLRLPDGLAQWIPPEVITAFASLLATLTSAVDAMFVYLPALAGGLSAAVWLIWGVGSTLIVVLGLLLSGLIALLRRRAPATNPPQMAASS